MVSSRTGCSPYDMARLADEYPAVFDEFVELHMPSPTTFSQRRARTRGQRVARLLRG